MTCWSKALMTLLLCACGLEARSALEAENSGSKAAFWGAVESAQSDENAPRLTLRLEEADIRGLLVLLADQLGLSVLISDDVEVTLSMSLVDVPASDAWVLCFKRLVWPSGNIRMFAMWRLQRSLLSARKLVEQRANRCAAHASRNRGVACAMRERISCSNI